MPDRILKAYRRSLRFRLTLWVVGIFAIIHIAFSAVLFLYQRASVDAFFTTRLRDRAATIAVNLAGRVPRIDNDALQWLAFEEASFALFEGPTLMLFDDASNLVASSQRHEPGPAGDLAAQTLDNPAPIVTRLPIEFAATAGPAAADARACFHPFTGVDGRRYVLVFATADTYARRMLSRVAGVLLVSFPATMVAAVISGWLIGGIAIAPLRQIRQAAQRLSPQSIDEEVYIDSTATEVTRLEEELEAARDRMAVAFRSQERFMLNVSHELKTPISVILTQSQVLELNEEEDEALGFVESVREEMRRLGAMIDSFLLLTRVREGWSISNAQHCPINDLIMDSVEECSAWAAQHHVFLSPHLLDRDDLLDAGVRGDSRLLVTLMNNLINNAVRFSPPHSSVDISATTADGSVEIAVRDRGPGVPPALLDRIFDRFVQAPAEKREGRGHGLGLEIAQGIAELHGGSIRVRNVEPAGCEFAVRLPLARPGEPSPTTGEADDSTREA